MTGVELFEKYTRYDISKFFANVKDFMSRDYSLILRYYQGGVDLPSESFETLDRLMEETLLIEALFLQFPDDLSVLDLWQVLDVFEDCKTNLELVQNGKKWFQSTRVLNQTINRVEKKSLRSGQSLESAARENNYSDPENSWRDISIKNLLSEESYNVEGLVGEGGDKRNVNYKVVLRENISSNPINTVVDNLDGVHVLGKDISLDFGLEISFGEDPEKEIYGDVGVVEYWDAITQAANIYIGLVQGDIPEFRFLGYSSDLVGSNTNALQYPMIVRALSEVLSTDGRWKGFELLSINQKDDNISFSFSFETVVREKIAATTQL